MTVRTRAQLNSDADTNIEDNTSGAITPSDVRTRIKDLADSALLAEDLAVTPASAASPTKVDFKEDTDNGTNKVALTAPASIAADVEVVLPGVAGTLATLAGTETLTNKTLTDPVIVGTILEDIFTITDGAAFEIDPGNGSIQKVTLGANRTPAATNFANGESILLMVADGTAYTITWTTVGVVWVGGSAPTLTASGFSHVVLWKENNIIRGKSVGDTTS